MGVKFTNAYMQDQYNEGVEDNRGGVHVHVEVILKL